MKKNVTWRALKMYHGFHRAYFPLKGLETLLRNFSPYFNLWMSAEIVTALYQGRKKEEIYLLAAVTLLVNLFTRIAGAFLGRATINALETLENNQALAFYKKTLSLDYDKLENPEIRQLRRKIVENSWINGYGVTNMRWQVEWLMDDLMKLAFSLILTVEMVTLMVRASFQWLGLLLFLLVLGVEAAAIIFANVANRKAAAYWDKTGEQMLWENQFSAGTRIQGMDNRIYRQQLLLNRLEKKLNDEHLKIFGTVDKKSFLYSIPKIIFFRLIKLFTCLIVCLYCILGAFPIGSVIKYVGYLEGLINCVGNLFTRTAMLKTNRRFLETYLEYFDIKNDMYQGSLAVEKRSDRQFEIMFRNVSFRYAGSEEDALKDINLSLRAGERLAVVGRNGSGKTTFIKLMCRLYDPTEGEVILNDFNVRKYDYRQYLELFSVVFQDYNLLSVPLGNNVASAAEWEQEKAERLLRQAGFGERYDEMPKGLETPLYKDFDEDGVNLSGGEAQKVALARALYRDAPFIILDEPTAALDPIAEAEIYARFDEIVGNRTAIYISHRLSSCRFCDRIAVFDQGRIVQLGTHEELLADEGGRYYELWQAQAQYYA